jgi:signal transduction histidine kinase
MHHLRKHLRKILFAFLVLIVIGIGILHFQTPGYMIFHHDMYKRLSYFPIVLGGLWFGVWGGLVLALMSSIAFIPHLLLYIGQGPETYLSELSEVILYIAAGTVTGIIAGRESVLRRRYKELSEKLEKSYAKLHNETQLLLEVEEQLSAAQKFSALGQMSASLAHEIKNPLGSIKGTAEILLDDFPPGHPKREFVEILLKETSRLNNTVEEVLQFSGRRRKKGADGMVVANEPISRVVERVRSLLANQMAKKYISFSITGAEAGNSFYVAGDKLSQVFLNLILNAIDAVPLRGEIAVKMKKQGNSMLVSVEDDGPGVPEDDKEKIFTPFYSSKEDGTGLGLSISKKIIESYGGELTVSARKTGGSCFTVFLPDQTFKNDIPGNSTVGVGTD